MATPAERKRRSRAHGKGDHSLCDLERCDGVTPAPAAAKPVTPVTPPPVTGGAEEPARTPGEIEAEVAEFVGSLRFDQGDPRRILSSIAVKLARKVDDAASNASAVKQLTVLLGQLAEQPELPPGPLDGIRAKQATRRIGNLLAQQKAAGT